VIAIAIDWLVGWLGYRDLRLSRAYIHRHSECTKQESILYQQHYGKTTRNGTNELDSHLLHFSRLVSFFVYLYVSNVIFGTKHFATFFVSELIKMKKRKQKHPIISCVLCKGETHQKPLPRAADFFLLLRPWPNGIRYDVFLNQSSARNQNIAKPTNQPTQARKKIDAKPPICVYKTPHAPPILPPSRPTARLLE
jgi:hypothetical protein